MSRMFASGTSLGLHGTGLPGVPFEREKEAPGPMKRPGDALAWDSCGRTKRGRVLGVVAGGSSLRARIEELTGRPAVCVQAQDVAQNDRYVVAVPRPRSFDYHAPVVRVIDNGLRKQEQAQAAAKRARR